MQGPGSSQPTFSPQNTLENVQGFPINSPQFANKFGGLNGPTLLPIDGNSQIDFNPSMGNTGNINIPQYGGNFPNIQVGPGNFPHSSEESGIQYQIPESNLQFPPIEFVPGNIQIPDLNLQYPSSPIDAGNYNFPENNINFPTYEIENNLGTDFNFQSPQFNYPNYYNGQPGQQPMSIELPESSFFQISDGYNPNTDLDYQSPNYQIGAPNLLQPSIGAGNNIQFPSPQIGVVNGPATDINFSSPSLQVDAGNNFNFGQNPSIDGSPIGQIQAGINEMPSSNSPLFSTQTGVGSNQNIPSGLLLQMGGTGSLNNLPAGFPQFPSEINQIDLSPITSFQAGVDQATASGTLLIGGNLQAIQPSQIGVGQATNINMLSPSNPLLTALGTSNTGMINGLLNSGIDAVNGIQSQNQLGNNQLIPNCIKGLEAPLSASGFLNQNKKLHPQFNDIIELNDENFSFHTET